MNYIGSKVTLLPFIDNVVKKLKIDKDNIIFCDIFTGTSSVSKFYKEKGYTIISNDIQFYSYIMAKHFIYNNNELVFNNLKKNGIEPFNYLNNISGIKGFIYNNYTLGGTINSEYNRLYFTDNNAMKIDAIRTQIENWKNDNFINDNEYCFLLASLIESADKVANTASVYEAFLKKIKKTAEKELVVKPIDTVISNKENYVYNEDANSLIKKIKGDILYLDPPYNTRKYNTNYHMLETIALYDKPTIKGKTGVRIDEDKKSKYNSKKDAKIAFEHLIKYANFKYILLSYNDEGIITIDEIKNIMNKYGKYSSFKMEYKRFKSNNNKQNKNVVYEYIHCLEKII